LNAGETLSQLCLQTRGARQIVSKTTIFDGDLHSNILA
jgi:hypothetical protein